MDSVASVPGTNIRFGLDALVGLIPGVGDVAGGMASGYVILESARMGASRAVLTRMLGNVLVEVVAGAVPLLGDVFDVAWKANDRNVVLLERHLGVRTQGGAPRKRVGALFVAGLLGLLMVAIVGVLWLLIVVVRAL